MVSSAVYRYFPSRDELLTALIIDAYDAVGERAEEAETASRNRRVDARWLKVCEAVRKVVGDDFTLMLDSTWSYRYPDAVRENRRP